MKKIIILITFLFILTGCYDYKEINNLGIISAIGIDYEDGKYIVTLEVLNDQTDKDNAKIKSYTKTGSDKSLAKAIEAVADKISDQANYTHVKLMILSETIIKDKFSNIIDFFIRSTYFRENFYVISSLDVSPKKILNNTTEENPIASSTIISLLESLNYSSNSGVLKTYDQIIEEIVAFGKDTCFSNIMLDDEQFKLDGLTIFDEYEYKTKLNNEEATIYNILTNNFYRPIFSQNYENDKYFSIAMTSGNISTEIKDNKIIITGSLNGKIMDNEPNFDIRDEDTLAMLNDDFKKIMNNKLQNFLQKIQDNNSDILFLAESYYHKTREKSENFWHNLKIESNIDFAISKKGLIYEVHDEEK